MSRLALFCVDIDEVVTISLAQEFRHAVLHNIAFRLLILGPHSDSEFEFEPTLAFLCILLSQDLGFCCCFAEDTSEWNFACVHSENHQDQVVHLFYCEEAVVKLGICFFAILSDSLHDHEAIDVSLV